MIKLSIVEEKKRVDLLMGMVKRMSIISLSKSVVTINGENCKTKIALTNKKEGANISSSKV